MFWGLHVFLQHPWGEVMHSPLAPILEGQPSPLALFPREEVTPPCHPYLHCHKIIGEFDAPFYNLIF